jgi:hypothetical protein
MKLVSVENIKAVLSKLKLVNQRPYIKVEKSVLRTNRATKWIYTMASRSIDTKQLYPQASSLNNNIKKENFRGKLKILRGTSDALFTFLASTYSRDILIHLKNTSQVSVALRHDGSFKHADKRVLNYYETM